jgi:multicomponent Na+:H+ antiporter subunit D
MIAPHLPILPVLILLGGALAVPLLALAGRALPWWFAVFVAVAAAGTSLAGLSEALAAEGPLRYAVGGWAPPIGIELVLDPLSAFMASLVSLVGAVVLLHSREPVARELPGKSTVYYSAALLLLAGLCGIVLTGDLFNLYVFLEIAALAGYALLGCGTRRAALATFRYLMLGTLGASFYLIGLGFAYVQTGSLNMADAAAIFAVTGLDPLTLLALAFMVVGIGLKMALLPLHQWLPDAYSAAPAASTALIAPIGTKVAAYVLLRLLFEVFPPGPILRGLHVLDLIAWLGAAGILWGSVMAIPQRDLKRMLAYSSVAQIGYIALGIGLGSAYGFIGAVLHMLNHAVMKACLFLVAANLEARGFGVDINRLDARLRRAMPATAAAFVLAALSMIGLPPTAGFFSKWYLLLGCVQEHHWFLVAVMVASSLLNAVYFFRLIERMYLGGKPEDESPAGAAGAPAPAGAAGTLALLTVPTVALALSLLALGLGNVLLVKKVIVPMVPFAAEVVSP